MKRSHEASPEKKGEGRKLTKAALIAAGGLGVVLAEHALKSYHKLSSAHEEEFKAKDDRGEASILAITIDKIFKSRHNQTYQVVHETQTGEMVFRRIKLTNEYNDACTIIDRYLPGDQDEDSKAYPGFYKVYRFGASTEGEVGNDRRVSVLTINPANAYRPMYITNYMRYNDHLDDALISYPQMRMHQGCDKQEIVPIDDLGRDQAEMTLTLISIPA